MANFIEYTVKECYTRNKYVKELRCYFMAENQTLSRQQSKQEKLEKRNLLINRIMLIPLIVVLGIIPLIVRLQITTPDVDVAIAMGTSKFADFFSSYKASFIILTAVAMLVVLFLVAQKEMFKVDKTTITYMICSGLFIITSLAATVMSQYGSAAWWGIPDRCEGMVVTACYILILMYALMVFRKYDSYKYIILALAVVVAVNAFFGYFQYVGKDLIVNNQFVQNLVISKTDQASINGLSGLIDKGTIYGTMFHYNYVGSFAAMMVPLFVTLTLFLKGKKNKIFCGIVSLLAVFLLFGSTSRAGLIGFGVALVFGIIIFARKMMRKWKIVVPVILAAIVVVFGFNAATNGQIFSRIPTLVNDITSLFSGADTDFDYKDHIPVRNVIIENGTATLETQDDALTFKAESDGVATYDKSGNPVAYTVANGTYTTTDSRFSNISYVMGQTELLKENEVSVPIVRVTVNGIEAFLFKVDPTEGLYAINDIAEQKIEIKDAPYVGFKGKEKVGSARGYIWSRSIPMLKETWLVGKGPDTFALEFPQNDILAKWWAYNTPNMIIDKPHNLYLQFAINNGGLALLAFLILVIVYVVNCFKLYAFRGFYENKEIIGIATFLAIMGYLGAGFFNDSVVSVAPVFWALLGTGMAINYMINKERVENERRVAHATIDMKTKKHLAK
mgnify:CR=1 FL=1